jgi:hypothetical protein
LTQNVNSSTSVYIEVELLGIPVDSMSRKTKPSAKNSLNPIWQETFVFQVLSIIPRRNSSTKIIKNYRPVILLSFV